MAGYSGKPLAQKIGIAPGATIALIGAPRDFAATLAPLPADVTLTTRASKQSGIVVLFGDSAARMSSRFATLAAELPAGGMLWVAWPKKSSGVATDLTEDVVRRIGLATGLVDVKVCAIDDTWSGLKFVRRKVSP